MGLSNDDVKKSWVMMVDHHLDSIFISRQASINNGVMTPEEADKIIIDISNRKIEKYKDMDDNLIHAIMLRGILSRLVDEMEEELND